MRRCCSPECLVTRCLFVLCLTVLWLLTASVDTSAQTTGKWSAVQTLPYLPVHATVLPNGKVLFFSYYTDSLHPYLWDPATGATSLTDAAPYELFCSGHTVMADGRVFVTGGHIADYTGYAHAQIFDPSSNTFTAVPDMNAGRWYPTNTVLPNGDILVVSGDMTSNTSPNPLPQVYEVGNGSWRNLTTAQLQMPLYPVMLVAPDGRVFNAGPSRQSRFLNPSGTGTWTLGPLMTFAGSRDYGPGLFYEAGKVLEIGGSDPPTATAETIDLNAASPTWKATGSMHSARRQHNAVVLPDGKVLVVGGSSGAGFDNANAPVVSAEVWDPATGAWTVMASSTGYRGYHSSAFLLPDGRVFLGGGNTGGANYQIFSPAYLFAGSRPTISSAPSAVGFGQTVAVVTPDAARITKVTLARLPSVTHTFDQNQRFLSLTFTQATGVVNVTLPSSENVVPPGHYMLFLVASGVPSVAKIIQVVKGSGPTTGTVTGTVTNPSGTALLGASVSGGGSSATTLSDGSYTLANVTPGSVTITASLAGYQDASTTVTVTAGNTTAAGPLQLTASAGGDVTGSVVTSAGAGIAGASVTGAGVSTTTDTTGNYTLSNLPAGAVTIRASASGFTPASTTVTVQSGTSVAAPTLTLTSNVGSVTGTVKSAAGAVIAGATVGFGGGSTTTNASGVYSLANVPAGTIQLTASAAGYSGQLQNVNITAGATATANFSLTVSSGSISGVVTKIANGVAISGAVVKWSGGSTTTNSSGVYTLNNVAAGTQTVTASASGFISRSLTATVSGELPASLNLALATGGKLKVVAKTATGAVVSGATVTLSGGVVPTTVTGTTSTTGYVSPWIPVGSYTITVSKTGRTTQSKTANATTGTTTTVTISNF